MMKLSTVVFAMLTSSVFAVDTEGTGYIATVLINGLRARTCARRSCKATDWFAKGSEIRVNCHTDKDAESIDGDAQVPHNVPVVQHSWLMSISERGTASIQAAVKADSLLLRMENTLSHTVSLNCATKHKLTAADLSKHLICPFPTAIR